MEYLVAEFHISCDKSLLQTAKTCSQTLLQMLVLNRLKMLQTG